MKKTLNLTGLGVGAALVAFCAFTPALRADVVIVNNLANTVGSHTGAAQELVQDFTPTVGGQISSVTLQLDITTVGSIVVNLYSGAASATSAGTLVGALGTITATTTGDDQQFTLSGGSLAIHSLASGTVYGIEIAGTTTIGSGLHHQRQTATGSSGSFTGHAWGDGGSGGVTWTQGAAYTMMSVNVVPEVPMTGMVMGFGALAIAAGHTLRRTIKAVAPAKI